MGSRNTGGKRFEAPYTLEVETPHVRWANPLPGGPIHLLAVPTVGEGRTLVELAQHPSLDLTTVSIDPDWDVNKWTMSFGADYGARAEKGDLKLVYSYLEQELTSQKNFDAILLPLNHGWNMLTLASREALARRVNEGCGLILIRPSGQLSPLTPMDLIIPTESEFVEQQQEGQTEASPWRRIGDHYIARAIPVETFPFGDVQNYIYRAMPDATVLIRTESGNPVLAVRQFGQGHVVAFGYRNHGLSWQMPMSARGHFVDTSWEYFYSLLVRAIIHAAGREPKSVPDFNGGSAIWRLRDEYNQVLRSGEGRPPQFMNLASGRYYLEQQLAADWKITPIKTGQPEKIDELKAEPELIAEGASVEVRWKGIHTARIELVDGFGRVIGRAEGSGIVRFTALRPLTHSGFVRAVIGDT
jgi:hypothetical protein